MQLALGGVGAGSRFLGGGGTPLRRVRLLPQRGQFDVAVRLFPRRDEEDIIRARLGLLPLERRGGRNRHCRRRRRTLRLSSYQPLEFDDLNVLRLHQLPRALPHSAQLLACSPRLRRRLSRSGRRVGRLECSHLGSAHVTHHCYLRFRPLPFRQRRCLRCRRALCRLRLRCRRHSCLASHRGKLFTQSSQLLTECGGSGGCRGGSLCRLRAQLRNLDAHLGGDIARALQLARLRRIDCRWRR
mmetsp:Transcript_28657/g.67153  ORF Transcript_28657/g.67153 Transcript_28657/m.67153 type:complete len:242 (-) Transcript_28657:59-784(-)